MDLEDRHRRVGPGRQAVQIHALVLQQVVSELDAGIVPAVAFAIHASRHGIPGQPGWVRMPRILAAAVRVVRDDGRRAIALRRLVEPGEYEFLRHPGARRPAHDLARVEVLAARPIQPS